MKNWILLVGGGMVALLLAAWVLYDAVLPNLQKMQAVLNALT